MADSDSSSDLEVNVPRKPPPKRRRIINPTSISTVPIYTNKVNKCLQLKPEARVLSDKTGDDDNLWSPTKKICIDLLLSDEEEGEGEQEVYICSSSPSSSESPVQKVSRRTNRTLKEHNKKAGGVGPPPESRGRRGRHRAPPSLPPAPSPRGGCQPEEGSCTATPPRQIPLKFRCRTELHKIHVLSSAPLSKAVDQLSVKLSVPPSRILLLRGDMALSTRCSLTELGLGIADIIDCVVTATDNTATDNSIDRTDDSDIITVRLQGKEKGSSQEFSLHREEALGSILSQYLSNMAAGHKVHFRYDGSKVVPSQTPAQLDMEDGDVIEVWAQ